MRRGGVGVGPDHGAPYEDVGKGGGTVEEAAGVVEVSAGSESGECDEAAQREDLVGEAADDEVGVDLCELFHGSAEVEEGESWVLEFEECGGLGMGLVMGWTWGSCRKKGKGSLRVHFLFFAVARRNVLGIGSSEIYSFGVYLNFGTHVMFSLRLIPTWPQL